MISIGLISDTHGFLDPAALKHFQDVDEIWHAGDIGTTAVADNLENQTSFKAVYGNIDGSDLRIRYPEHLKFKCEGLNVWLTHIGGYPGRYNPQIITQIQKEKPDLFICGHSHILKVMPDKKLGNLLHINPGAAGKHGFHKVRTIIKFKVEDAKIFDMKAIELGPRA